MCGFAGEARFDSSLADVATVARMGDALRARGPDASGAFQQGHVAFAHRRLRIIDLSEHAQQPMTDPALGLSIVFNGCIYNYRELRRELEALDYRFFSEGDTEVVLKAFHAWGRACVERFQGMFSFGVVERPDCVRFASSLPALLAGGDVDTSIDAAALHNYLSWHAVVPPPRTILCGVRKLPPATVVSFDAEGRREEHRYWQLRVEADPALAAQPVAERERQVEQALRTAVRRRMVADVPVGVLLSGGVDSSLIVALLADLGQHDLRTFSIGFEAAAGEAGDEFVYSDMIARRFGTRHEQIRIPTSELMAALPATIAAMSEPMVSYDNVAFFLLSREVARHLKVVQSGQGADEVFAGYHWYPKLAELGPGAHADAVDAYARAFFDGDHADYLATVTDRWSIEDVSRSFVERQFAANHGASPVEKALQLDTTIMLADDPVKRVDNMTMAWGLEARVPFLDHELVELAGRLPIEDKLGDGGKGVLKSIARRLVPREVVDRPKGYFPVPILKYIDGPVLEMVRDALTSRPARERGLFRPEMVTRLLDDPSKYITPLRGSRLWQVALLEMWLQAHSL